MGDMPDIQSQTDFYNQSHDAHQQNLDYSQTETGMDNSVIISRAQPDMTDFSTQTDIVDQVLGIEKESQTRQVEGKEQESQTINIIENEEETLTAHTAFESVKDTESPKSQQKVDQETMVSEQLIIKDVLQVRYPEIDFSDLLKLFNLLDSFRTVSKLNIDISRSTGILNNTGKMAVKTILGLKLQIISQICAEQM